MSPQPASDLIAELRESQKKFHSALADVSDSVAGRAPKPGAWNILQIVEHLSITEGSTPLFYSGGVKKEDAVRDPARESAMKELVEGRSSRIEAPEAIHPTGRYATLAEALAAFDDRREANIRFAHEHAHELDTFMVTHPLVGEISLRHLILLHASHSTRHIPQIEECVSAARA